MVKCTNCGLEVSDNFKNCPNCGNNLSDLNEEKEIVIQEKTICSNCGTELKENNSFCPSCGTKVQTEEDSLKCEKCGADLPKNTLFCTTCGTKVNTVPEVIKKLCPNCGTEIDEGSTFCDECGTNIFTGEKNNNLNLNSTNSFVEKINLNVIVKPAIVALIVALILSFIGLLIGFSWLSFIIAIILSAGFFGAAIDNEANAIVFGFIVGLILGLLESPLVEFTYGTLVKVFYDGLVGGNIILIIVFGIVMAYVSNIYLKENILRLTDNFKGML